MKKYSKAYIEITNVCNLSCRFCPKTMRKPQMMSVENFQKVINAIDNLTDYVYFHVLGEPTIHPDIAEFVKIANNKNKKITITTNGTNLNVLSDILKTQSLYKVNLSLQAVGGNDKIEVKTYMKTAIEFAKTATEKGVIVVLRLWNEGSEFNRNEEIMAELEFEFGKIEFGEKDNVTLSKHLYLERAEEFQWRCENEKTAMYCYGLRDQFAILVDGTVLPCCIDSEGDIPLGNVFEGNLAEILNGERANAIVEGFNKKTAVEKRCRHCGYARRFKV